MEPNSSAQQPLPPGTRLDAYLVRGVLGYGGFGVTYEAVEPELERRVAIKEYFPESLAAREADGTTLVAQGDEESYTWGLTRFLDEARTLARFKNPHIVHVNRYLEANGTAYLVMDYEDGHPLSAVLKKRRVGERAVRKLMVPILKGLRAVHEQNFLHRDIKPGNIFLRRDGPPLLIDFGAARQALQQRAAAAMTVILTPGYAPLEQYGDGQDDQQGPWTDLYALGATLFHCLTGKAPRDAAWRVQAGAHGVPDSIREALNPPTPLCSPEMVELLCWMLRPFAKDRPQSCDQVAAALYDMSRSPARATVGGPRSTARSDEATMHIPSMQPTISPGQGAPAPMPPAADYSRAPPAQYPSSQPPASQGYPQQQPPSQGYSQQQPPSQGYPQQQPPSQGYPHGYTQQPPSQGYTQAPPAQTSQGPIIPPSDVLAAELALMEHMGPIAKVLVKQAAAACTSRAEFLDRLADDIDDSRERQKFLTGMRR